MWEGAANVRPRGETGASGGAGQEDGLSAMPGDVAVCLSIDGVPGIHMVGSSPLCRDTNDVVASMKGQSRRMLK